MTLVVTHNVVTGAVADPTAIVDGPAWDANHTLTGVASPVQGGTGVANDAASTITITGSFGITFTVSAATSITLPTTGTLATLAGAEALTNKTYNKVTITAPATSATLTIPDGVTLTGPAASGTTMTLGNAETVTGAKTFGSAGAVGKLKIAGTTSGSTILDATAVASGTLTLPAATDTLVGKATTDTLTNKTFDTAGAGNSLSINGVAASANTGTGSVVRATSPALVTPDLGTPSAVVLTNASGTASININGTVGATTPAAITGTAIVGNTSMDSPIVRASGTLTNVKGTTGSDLATLVLAGGSGANGGAYLQLGKNTGGNITHYAGHESAIFGGGSSSSNIVLYNAGIGGGLAGRVWTAAHADNSMAFASTVDSTSVSTGSINTAGGIGAAKALFGGTTLNIAGVASLASGTATPAGGSTSARLLFGTTAGFGIYYGSGAPTVSAAQGSIYLRSDGSSTSTRMYVNTNGSTTWTNVTTAA